MPKIPRIEPTLNTTTTQSPNAFQRDPGYLGKAIETVGGVVSDVGEMFQKANMVAEKTKAQNDLDSKLNDIHTRAANDNDISDKKRKSYDDEINKAVIDSSHFITLPEEKNLFTMDAKAKGDITRAHVNSVYMKKTVEEGKQNLDIYLDNKKNDFIQSNNLAEKNTAILERDTKIDEMVGAGFLTPAEATKLRDTQRKDWSKSQVEYDIATNPELAKQLLKDKSYSGITEKERVDYVDKANSAVRKNRKDFEEDSEARRISNEADYLTKLSTGDLSWMNVADVANDVRMGNVSERFGLAMTDVLKSEGEYEPKAVENENYPEFVNNIYKARDQKELNNALLGLLQDHKNISQEKLAVLISGAMQRSKSLPLSAVKGGQVDPKQQEVDSAAMAVTNFGRRSGMSNNEIASIYQNFNKDVAAGKSPKEAYDNAVRTHVIEQYPMAATFDTPPNMIITKDSPIRIIFPRNKGTSSATAKPSKDVSK